MPITTQQTPYCPQAKGFKSEDDESLELESPTSTLRMSITFTFASKGSNL